MPIVGCYSLHLYCDNKSHKSHDIFNEKRFETTGKNITDCKQEARKKGWKFYANNTCTCPDCIMLLKASKYGEKLGKNTSKIILKTIKNYNKIGELLRVTDNRINKRITNDRTK